MTLPLPMNERADYGRTRVVKRLAPHQPGAMKLATRFGSTLVCVRYRHDVFSQQRYTTVELVVDEAPIRARRVSGTLQIVAVRIKISEIAIRQLLKQHHAVWDGKSHLWYVQHSTAKALGLLSRVV